MASAQSPVSNPQLNSHPSTLDNTKIFLVGVAIFQKSNEKDPAPQHELLVIKRASSEETFPNSCEIPGGHIEPTDRNIHHSIERETLEETGLIVEDILGEFEALYWNSEKTGLSNIQLNYAVSVKKGMPIRLNPEEHSEWLWVREDQLQESLCMTSGMRRVLRDAFSFARKYVVI